MASVWTLTQPNLPCGLHESVPAVPKHNHDSIVRVPLLKLLCLWLQVSGLLDQLKAASTDAKAPAAREGAFVAYGALAAGAPALAEPYLVPTLSTILEKCSDKVCVAIPLYACGKLFS